MAYDSSARTAGSEALEQILSGGGMASPKRALTASIGGGSQVLGMTAGTSCVWAGALFRGVPNTFVCPRALMLSHCAAPLRAAPLRAAPPHTAPHRAPSPLCSMRSQLDSISLTVHEVTGRMELAGRQLLMLEEGASESPALRGAALLRRCALVCLTAARHHHALIPQTATA